MAVKECLPRRGAGRPGAVLLALAVLSLACGSCAQAAFDNPFDPASPLGALLGFDATTLTPPRSILLSGLPGELQEGSSAQAQVRLGNTIESEVIVTILIGDPSVLSTSRQSLTFMVGQATVPQSITLTAVADPDTTDATSTLSFSATDYTSIQRNFVNRDVDTHTMIITGSSALTENGATGSIGVRLADAPSSNIVVSLSSSAPGSLTLASSQLTFTPANYSVVQNVTITPVNDADWSTNSVLITASHATLGTAKHSVTVADDEVVFAARVEETNANAVMAITAGDLDGDSKADVVIGRCCYGIEVRRSTSSGSTIAFNLDVTPAPTGFIYEMETADLDGDGKRDLIVSAGFDDVLDIFRNTSSVGSISFAARQNVTTGRLPRALAIADLDGDGKSEVIVVNSHSTLGDSISVFRNTSSVGTISFAAGSTFSVNDPVDVVAGDLDGDGKIDIAVTARNSNRVALLRNTSSGIGNIAFSSTNYFDVGSFLTASAIGDVDGDGKLDLAIASGGSDLVSILRNTSTVGNLSFVRTDVNVINPANAAFLTDVELVDLDADGKRDLVFLDHGRRVAGAMRNSSTSGLVAFESQLDFSLGASDSGGQVKLAFGDINGGGRIDLASGNSILGGPHSFGILRNTLP